MALKLCRSPGCIQPTSGRYCNRCREREEAKEEERARKREQERGTSGQRGYTYEWQKYRERFLNEHRLCVVCLAAGIAEGANEVDHIVPVTGPNDPLFRDTANHQALCRDCHVAKTRREGRTAGGG